MIKQKPSWLGLGIVVLLLLGSYWNFIHQSQALSGRLFELADTVSWKQSSGNIFRREARGNAENILLSKNAWKDLTLSTLILNPRDCGLVFNYQNDRNFNFLIFEPQNGWVFWGAQRNGEYTVLKKGRFQFPQAVLCELKVQKDKAELFLNRQFHSSLEEKTKVGKVGLMNKAVALPPTVFKDIVIQDKGGIYRNAETFGPLTFKDKKLWAYIFSVGFLLLALGLTVYFLLLFFQANRYFPFLEKVEEDQRFAFGTHFLAAVFIFWPFFSRGEILVSSSDNLGQIYPLFIYSYQNFWNFLQTQTLSLWNPYVHNGLPFFSNHWNMTYYPLNWPLFFLSEHWLLWGVTLRSFVETFLVGVLSYKFFQREFGSNPWAFLSSIVFQLCSLLIFSFSIFPTVSLIFSLMLYLYLLWSMDSRKPHGNFFYLTLSVALFLTSANMAFVFYGGLVLITMTAYRLISLRGANERKKAALIVGASLLTGLLIAAVRVVSCIFGVAESNRLVENFYTLHERLAMAIRLFVPEITGWLGNDFLNALTSSNLNLIFRSIDLPSNSQNTFFIYFGVAAALMFGLGLILKLSGRLRFWKIYALVTIALGLMLQPFWGIFNILFFPFNHYSYYIIIIPLGFCGLLGYIGLQLEKQKEDVGGKLPLLGLLTIFVQAYILVFVTYLFPVLTGWTRAAFVVLALWCLTYFYGRKNQAAWQPTFVGLSLRLAVSLVFALCLVAATVVFMAPIPKKEEAFAFVIIPGLIALFVIANILLKKMSGSHFGEFVLCFVIAMIGFLGVNHWLHSASDPERNYFLDMAFGESKFILSAVIFFVLLVLYARNRLSRQALWGILFFVVLIDLFGFNARFDNVVAPTPHQKAFYPVVYPYQDIEPTVKRGMDLANYRTHYLHQAGLKANENLIFKIPSYSGIAGHMPKRFSKFIVNFGYPKETVLIYPEESTDDARFLDLCAVKYKFFSPAGYEGRGDSALSRMMLFSDFEVVADDQSALNRLKDAAFIPTMTVLLKENLVPKSVNKNVLKVELTQRSTDEVTAKVNNSWSAPAVLLFIETYSSGWKAYVDGKKVPIVPANYAFMAIAVEPGQHEVRFVYAPELFYLTRNLSVLAIFLFLGISLFFWFKGIKP